MNASQFGNFQIQKQIAFGGMAYLYLAANSDGQSVVVRVLQPRHAQSRTHIRQFEFGAELLSELNHPSIPIYYDRGQQDGLPWVAMEYIPHPSLRQMLKDEVKELFINHFSLISSMATGLDHLHEHGYLHMDFKPENVLILPTGEVKIIDFDLAMPRPPKPIPLPMAGTPAYIAPEILLKQPADERADIFAFGLTAFELLTRRKAFGAGTAQEMYAQAKTGTVFDKVPSVCDLNPLVSSKLDRVIRGCLAKDPKARYPVMKLVVRDLQATQSS